MCCVLCICAGAEEPGFFHHVLLALFVFLPSGGVGITKALSSTSFRGSVISTLSPADTTSSLVLPALKCNTVGGRVLRYTTMLILMYVL